MRALLIVVAVWALAAIAQDGRVPEHGAPAPQVWSPPSVPPAQLRPEGIATRPAQTAASRVAPEQVTPSTPGPEPLAPTQDVLPQRAATVRPAVTPSPSKLVLAQAAPDASSPDGTAGQTAPQPQQAPTQPTPNQPQPEETAAQPPQAEAQAQQTQPESGGGGGPGGAGAQGQPAPGMQEGQPEQPAPATAEDIRALQQQIEALTASVDAATQRLDALEQQVAENAQQAQVVDESIEPRSVRANLQAQEAARQHRVGNFERALAYLQQVQDRISGGDLDEIAPPLTGAAAELEDAAAHAQLATPRENEHLVRAQQQLGAVWSKLTDHNSQYASISVLSAQMEASQALALARSQRHMNR
ncbi:MAG: hypothetical protein IRZ16_14065 [Myxococcaceae bacterium]|nr:hypothetical protein [Myxococcaceae bacterium]